MTEPLSVDPGGGALRDFRTRAIRSTATSLAVVNSVIVAIFAITAMVPFSDVLIVSVAVVTHVAAARTVGRRWQPGSLVAVAYIVTIVLLINASLSTSPAPDTEGFWFLLIPVGLSGLALSGVRHAVMSAFAATSYVVTAGTGGGLTPGLTAARLAALLALAWVAWRVTHRLEQALVREERSRLEQEALNRQLRELDTLKDDFVSTVSHELRTPLTVILGLSHTVNQRWSQLSADQRRLLAERIEANARSLDSIIGSLLDVARIERGHHDHQSELVSLSVLVGDAIERLDLLLRQHDVSLDLADDGTVLGDRALLERVVDNLLTNAARHTPPQTRVRVAVTRQGGSVRCSVSDDGPGIPEDAQQRLGERFYRAGDPDSRGRGGVGVGLALVTQVLSAHGATLEVASEPGRGAAFWFELPAAATGTGSGAAVADGGTPQR